MPERQSQQGVKVIVQRRRRRALTSWCDSRISFSSSSTCWTTFIFILPTFPDFPIRLADRYNNPNPIGHPLFDLSFTLLREIGSTLTDALIADEITQNRMFLDWSDSYEHSLPILVCVCVCVTNAAVATHCVFSNNILTFSSTRK